MVTGDGRMYVTALIVPQRNELLIYAAKNGIHYNEYEDLFGNVRLHDLIQKDIDRVQKNISGYERVRKFMLIEEPFTIEGGELTPTLKVKRKFVEKKYSDEIGKMYLNVFCCKKGRRAIYIARRPLKNNPPPTASQLPQMQTRCCLQT